MLWGGDLGWYCAGVPMPVEELQEGGQNAPITYVRNLEAFDPDAAPGVSRYQHTFDNGVPLDALLVNRESDVLVVSFHGALAQGTQSLPRFEWLRKIGQHDVSSLYFSDPALHLKDTLELAWFTGWEGLDLQQVMAQWSMAAARAIGATRIVFLGSSGGGFAALQVSALVPGSLALPFNPQTSIHAYLAGGENRIPQLLYVNSVWPQLAPGGADALDPNVDWSEPLGERASALRRYAHPVPNYVLYVENSNEFHYQDHYLPFLAATARGGNLPRVRVYEYQGSDGHAPPSPDHFHAALTEALEWVRTLPAVGRVGDETDDALNALLIAAFTGSPVDIETLAEGIRADGRESEVVDLLSSPAPDEESDL